ncbi:MAG: thiamine pyrophosphate-binding protein [Candidatus Methanoglobus sp.]
MDVAHAICDVLERAGVERVYGIIGTSIVDFVDALYDYKQSIRYISCRHEQVSASMADAEGRLTGLPGVALVHAAPGTLNAAIGVANAYKDGSPMVLISGGAKRRLYGKNTMLEVDQQAVMKPITMAAFRIDKPAGVQSAIAKAISIAVRECGPVYVEVAEDLWIEDSEKEEIVIDTGKPKAKDSEVEKVAEMLKESKRPLILAGMGINCSEGSRLLTEFAELCGIPVATTGNGRGAIDEEHELCLGRAGFGGGSLHADNAVLHSDFLLCLGCQLSDVTTYGYNWMPGGKIVAVTLDSEAGSKIPYTLLSYCDAVDFLKKLASKIDDYRAPEEWLREIETWRKSWVEMLKWAADEKYEGFANPSLFFKKLNEVLPSNAVVAAGQGMHVLYAQAFLKTRRPRSYIAATNHGAMGFGFPAAMAASLLGYTGIAVVGDGEFMMTVQDLETAVREKIPVKVVVVNDNSYRVLYFRQKLQKGGRIYGTLHSNPDFARLAEIFGAEGVTVSSDSEAEEAIKTMLQSEKPFVLDLRISPDSFAPFNAEASVRM